MLLGSFAMVLSLMALTQLSSASEKSAAISSRPGHGTSYPNLSAYNNVGITDPSIGTPPSYNGLALTPPMGFNDWYQYGCNVTEDEILANARALASSGLAKLGYNYVNVDDCWMASARDSDGNLQADPTRFPHGMAWLSAEIHSMGLKFGVYESVGTTTCNGLPGSYGHYGQDAETFATWGIDFLKFDFCGSLVGTNPEDAVKEMSQDLRETGRPIVFSQEMTAGQSANPDYQGLVSFSSTVSNMWRTSEDLETNQFGSVIRNLQDDLPLAGYAHPGAWNDLDMVLTGNSYINWTAPEQQSQMSIWAEMASPLLASTDLAGMSTATKRILSNQAVIAVDQDPLGAQGRLVARQGPVEIVTKPLANGDVAVLFVNTSPVAQQTATVSAQAIGIRESNVYAMRDLWTGQTTETSGQVETFVAPYSTVMYRVSPGGPFSGAPSAALSVTVPPTLMPGSPGQVQVSFTNNGRLPAQKTSLELKLPSSAWTVQATSSISVDTVAPGQTVSVRWIVTAPTSAGSGQSLSTATITASATYTWPQAGGATDKLSAPVTSYVLPTVLHQDLASAYNNVGITDPSNADLGQFFGDSYSASALEAQGFTPGATLQEYGLTFNWPDVPSGTPDNVDGGGMFAVNGSGNTLAFLGTGVDGTASETGFVIYADGSTQQYTVTFPNWDAGPSVGGARAVATMTTRNLSTGPQNGGPWYLYYIPISVDPTKKVAEIVLPSDQYAHVFSLAIGAAASQAG